MSDDGKLEIAAGFATAQGARPDNQDFGAVELGTANEQVLQGIIAAVADGVGGAKGGRIAAELAVRSFIDGYRAQDPVGGIAAAGITVMQGYNRWLHEQGRIDPAMTGAATTFTALVLRGREAVTLHVGDSRAWHFRDGVLTRLTEDHVLPQPDLNHVLYRAAGIEAELRLDSRRTRLAPHDRLLLASDGVHGVLSDRVLTRLLAARATPDADAAAIVAAASAAGTRDNATAIVIDVVAVPALDPDIVGAEVARLPILPPPAPGDMVDGFRLTRLLSDGRYTRLFVAEESAAKDGEAIVLKFPKLALLSEAGARAAFLRESFIGQRINSPFVGRTLELVPDRQSRLYIAMPFLDGETLEARLLRAPLSVRGGLEIAVRLARGVAALHRRTIAHRDIKPENVMLTVDGGLKLIDLGVARLPRLADFAEAEAPGTPSYMAPEMYAGERGDERTDQYALGVTLYRMFTGRYPYGEIEAFSRPRFERPTPPSRYRDDLPAWLDAALLRTVAVDPAARFADVEELVHVLRSGSRQAVRPRPTAPLIERNPILLWKGVSLLLAIALIAALVTR